MAAWTAAAVGRRTACREDGGQRHLRNRAHDAYAAATRAGYRGPAHSAATPEHSGWVCKALPGTGATSGPGGRGLGADTVCRRRLSLRRVAEPRALRTGSTPLSGLGSDRCAPPLGTPGRPEFSWARAGGAPPVGVQGGRSAPGFLPCPLRRSPPNQPRVCGGICPCTTTSRVAPLSPSGAGERSLRGREAGTGKGALLGSRDLADLVGCQP